MSQNRSSSGDRHGGATFTSISSHRSYLVGDPFVEAEEYVRSKSESWVPEIWNATDEFLWEQRVEFFDALRELAPITIDSLREHVLPVVKLLDVHEREFVELAVDQYITLFKEYGARTERIYVPSVRDVEGGLLCVVSSSTLRAIAQAYRPELAQIGDVLTAWGKRFNLIQQSSTGSSLTEVPPWVQDIAWSTVYVWLRRPELSNTARWYSPAGVFQGAYDGVHGPKSVVKKWQRQHYRWLALFQVFGLSPRLIADRLGAVVSENAILRGIYSAARTVGIRTRQGKRGPRSLQKHER